MLPESNQIDLSSDQFGSSSTETISVYDHQVLNDGDFSENDEFVDTQDDFLDNTPTFEEALLDCRRAMAVFFNNDFNEATRICDKWKDVSPLHAITGSMFDAYFTFFTLEKDSIEKLRIRLKDCDLLLSNLRKQQTFSKYFFKANYTEDFTEEQLYYEFLQALMLLMSFFLTLFSDPTLLSIIKCAFKLKTANSILRNCEEMIKQKGNNWRSETIKNELVRGYSYVNGGMNLVMSHLPSKVLSILALIGFEGDRKKGIQNLQKCFDDKTTLFWLYCGIGIMGYNLYIEHILGLGHCDTTWSWKCIKDIVSRHPNSLVTFQFVAKAYLSSGDPEKGIEYFLRVIESNALNCKSLLNLCNWDLTWCYALSGDWLKAAEVATFLKEHCFWSPATNQYQQAVFIYTHALKTCDKDLLNKSFELMREVPNLRNRFAGRTIPWEKFVITKSEEFLKKGYLVAPAYELFYVWNVISNVAGKDKYLNLIENDLDKQIAIKRKLVDQPDACLDELCLLFNLKACVLRSKYEYEKSIECLRKVFQFENRIVNYTYIMPNACCDLGINYYFNDNLNEAKKYLHSARSDYTGYLAETMVHFKVHNALLCIKSKELKLTGFYQADSIDNLYESSSTDRNEIERIKSEVDRKKVISRFEMNSNEQNKPNMYYSATKLMTIKEENSKNQDCKQIYEKKSYSLDYSTRSRSETNLNIVESDFKSNLIGKTKNLNEINKNQIKKNQIKANQIKYSDNQMNGVDEKNSKINNELHLKELVNDLNSFKERLISKQRKTSILKRVKSLSKINFTKNLHNEMLKDEIEFDLQKNQKSNRKKLFKRNISGIF